MRYRLYLYATEAATGSAMAIGIVNTAISEDSEREWKGNYAANHMKPFDTQGIIRYIQDELTDPVSQTCKCRVVEKFPPAQYEQVGYLYVATSYAKAMEVLPKLHMIAAENDLVLYDAETHRTFFKDLIDKTYITMRNRQQALYHAIAKAMKPIWSIRQIEFLSEERDKGCSYVVTIKKDPQVSFEKRNEQFYGCLKANLLDGEELICEDMCYKIKGDWYTITYVLEGYKKHPDKIGYVEKDRPQVALLNRMGTDEALRWMETCKELEKKDIRKRMLFSEMQYKYPNPAERLVESIKITKWQRKQQFDIRYSGFGYYSSEILFHVVPDSYYQDGDNISVLKIEENSASFILPFVEDIYPDFYKRYYLEKNYLSSQMWERILERLKEAKEMILHDTFHPELKPYIEDFNLYVLVDHTKSDCFDEVRRGNEAQFLYEHRYQVAELYDVFIRWAEAQLKTHGYRDLMFNIQGP